MREVQIAIYTKNDAGNLSRRVENWLTIFEAIAHYTGTSTDIRTERLAGWPESVVDWYTVGGGEVGFAQVNS